ncbi:MULTISPECIES: acetylxylan esterase [unclassified Paenibacillus]|uniref:acetylxylan esterase n=1 Tax=unclassified Paenibacillus TaxID=185978 RepID=UPI002F428749
MPLVDMPMEKLKQYEGISPRPADFDAYWERALAEMKAVDPQIELVPSEFQVPNAECFHLYFTGVRGARIHAKYVRPKNIAKPHAAMLQFHGYTGHSGHWIDKLSYVAQGFSVFALDCRGQGGLSEDTGGVKGNTHHGHIIRGLDSHEDDLLFRHIFLDTAQLASIAMSMPEVDSEQVYAMGGSQGGALTIACASLEPKIKKLAPVYPFLSDYRRVWEMDLADRAYIELKKYFMLFDPRHLREEEMFNRLGYIDIQHLASRIKGEVLMGVGLMDTVCPPSTQFAAYNKITSPKRLEIYPDFGHEELPGFSEIAMQFFLE